MRKRKNIIGVVPSFAGSNMTMVPYNQGCINGIVNEANRLFQDVLLIVSYDQVDTANISSRLFENTVDGVVINSPIVHSELLEALRVSRLPFTAISATVEGAPCVTFDNGGGIELLVEHLISLGHRKIAHITGPPNMPDAIERLEAFRRVMESHRLAVPEDYVVRGGFLVDDGYEAMVRLIWNLDRPTAVVCPNDECAVGAIRAAWDNGIRVPEDISVTGFDNSIFAETVFPKLTTVRQPWTEMGSAALRKVVDLIEGRPAESEVLYPELVVRQSSTEPPEGHI